MSSPEENIYVDVMVHLDGDNPPFFSFMSYKQACDIQENGGLKNAEEIVLREAVAGDGKPARKIPQVLKDGLARVEDVWVVLKPNAPIYLN